MLISNHWFRVISQRVFVLLVSGLFVTGVLGTVPLHAAPGTLTVSLVPRPSDNVEVVSLFYEGVGTLSLAGWTIEDTVTNVTTRHTFADVTLSSGDTFRFCNWNGTRTDCDHHTFFSSIWNDTGDTLVLRNAEKEEILRISYTNATVDQVITVAVEINGTTDPLPIEGCTNPLALNFNALATIDDGSCEEGDGTGDGTGDDDVNEDPDTDTNDPPIVATVLPLPASQIPRVPGHCPAGFTKWIDEEVSGQTWYADDVYEVVVVVGGPPHLSKNRDGGRYLILTGPTKVGMAVTRTWHEIDFVCVR